MSGLNLDARLFPLDAIDRALASYGVQVPYFLDPVGWCRQMVDWPADGGLTDYQSQLLDMTVKQQRVTVRGPHGLGKTTTAALSILWFALTREQYCAVHGRDWKVVTTASAWRQLIKYLWPEVHKWARRLKWAEIGRDPFSRNELLDLQIKFKHGSAFAVASDEPALIEGAHADHLLYVFDEAKTIPDKTYDAAEGAFSGAGGESGREAYAMAISTPGPPSGRFYKIHKREGGYEDWWTRHVRLEEVIAAGRITREWVDQRKRQWGTDSAMFANRVLGEFKASDEDGVIPLEWIELANQRWEEWADGQGHAAGRGGLLQSAVSRGESADGQGQTLANHAPAQYRTGLGGQERPISTNGDYPHGDSGRIAADAGDHAEYSREGLNGRAGSVADRNGAEQRVDPYPAGAGEPGPDNDDTHRVGRSQCKLTAIGADIASTGADQTVFALRHEYVIIELRRYDKADTMQTVGRLIGIQRARGGTIVVDVIGVGTGPYQRLLELGSDVIPFNASAGCTRKDSSGELGFPNLRSAAWWNLRECLDPTHGVPVALPPDAQLTGDLTAPRWRPISGGKIQVEGKDDPWRDKDGTAQPTLRQRLGRSPDDGDAVVMAFAKELIARGIVFSGGGTDEPATPEAAAAEVTNAIMTNGSWWPERR